jgi:hypothetical protein
VAEALFPSKQLTKKKKKSTNEDCVVGVHHHWLQLQRRDAGDADDLLVDLMLDMLFSGRIEIMYLIEESGSP